MTEPSSTPTTPPSSTPAPEATPKVAAEGAFVPKRPNAGARPRVKPMVRDAEGLSGQPVPTEPVESPPEEKAAGAKTAEAALKVAPVVGRKKRRRSRGFFGDKTQDERDQYLFAVLIEEEAGRKPDYKTICAAFGIAGRENELKAYPPTVLRSAHARTSDERRQATLKRLREKGLKEEVKEVEVVAAPTATVQQQPMNTNLIAYAIIIGFVVLAVAHFLSQVLG